MVRKSRLMVKPPESKDSIKKIIKNLSEEIKKEDSNAFKLLSNKLIFSLFENLSEKSKDILLTFLIERISKKEAFKILFEHISEEEYRPTFNILIKNLSEEKISEVLDKKIPKSELSSLYIDLLSMSPNLDLKGIEYSQSSMGSIMFKGTAENIEKLADFLKEKGFEVYKL
ncbi:MAG: hypothetical protein R6U26_00745 [Candidatus Undinarchaeales archaeon]